MRVHQAQPRWILKRDGTRQRFTTEKIQRALLMAFHATDRNGVPDVHPLVDSVVEGLEGDDSGTVHIERVQDCVENTLMRFGYDAVAKQYIIYRNERAQARAVRMTPDPTIASDYMHAARYARWREDVGGRREIFEETSHRCRDMHLRRYPKELHPLILEAWELVDQRLILPSMRSLQFGGDAIEQNNTRIYNCSSTAIDRVHAFDEIFYTLLCGCGVGFSVQWHHIDQLPPVKKINRHRVRHYSVPDSIEGWAHASRRLMESFFFNGEWVEFDYSGIRDEGAWLRASGGLAPGHLPLRQALETVRELMMRAANRKLRPVEANDIVCYHAEAVRAGGIRRSSLATLFSPEDTEMMYSKMPGHYDPRSGLNSQRRMTNISAVLVRSRTDRAVFERIIRLADEGYGDPGFWLTNSREYIPNPCVTGDTRVLTSAGWQTIEDMLVGVSGLVDVVQDSRMGDEDRHHDGVVLTGTKPVYRLTTKEGYTIRLTADHKLMTQRGWVEAQHLSNDDRIHILSHPPDEVPTTMLDHAAYEAAGWYVGDGSAQRDNAIRLDFYGDKIPIGRYLARELCRLKLLESEELTGDHCVMRINRVSLLEHPIIQEVKKERVKIPDSLWGNSRSAQADFLRGLFSADGAVLLDSRGGACVQLVSTSLDLLRDVQLLMIGLGIVSSVYKFRVRAGLRKLPDGDGGLKEYQCAAAHELQIRKTNLVRFANAVGFLPGSKNVERLNEALDSFVRGPYSESFTARIESLEYCGKEKVYDIKNVEGTSSFIANGFVVHNCYEIGMFPFLITRIAHRSGFSFCNLSDVSCYALECIKDFARRVRGAAILGTLQAGYSDFAYLGRVTEEIVRRDSLIGVGLTGIADSPLAQDPKMQRIMASVVCETNREVAHQIGIRPAARNTTVKPAGKTSIIMGCIANGIHPRYARRYLFRINAKPSEPPAAAYHQANPHAIEEKPDGEWAVVFPMQAPADAITIKDESALQFLDRVKSTYENWVVPGTARSDDSKGLTHNVSATCTVRPGELEPVVDFIWKNRDSFASMSFVPYTLDKKYPFAPWEVADDERRWNHLIQHMRPVDWTQVREERGGEDFGSACEGTQCEV